MKKRSRITAALLACLLFTASCGHCETEYADLVPDKPAEEAGELTYAPVELPAAGKEPAGAEADALLSDAVTDFSEKFYKLAMPRLHDNAVFSPLSLYYALALTSNGAHGETAEEFAAALGMETSELNEYLYTLTANLAATKETTVTIGNSIWGNAAKFAINPAFRKIAEQYLRPDGEVQRLERARSAERTRANDNICARRVPVDDKRRAADLAERELGTAEVTVDHTVGLVADLDNGAAVVDPYLRAGLRRIQRAEMNRSVPGVIDVICLRRREFPCRVRSARDFILETEQPAKQLYLPSEGRCIAVQIRGPAVRLEPQVAAARERRINPHVISGAAALVRVVETARRSVLHHERRGDDGVVV